MLPTITGTGAFRDDGEAEGVGGAYVDDAVCSTSTDERTTETLRVITSVFVSTNVNNENPDVGKLSVMISVPMIVSISVVSSCTLPSISVTRNVNDE